MKPTKLLLHFLRREKDQEKKAEMEEEKEKEEEGNENPVGRAPVLEMPKDILLCITDHLASHDKFLLWQTCQTWNRVLSCNWKLKFDRMSPNKKMEFLLGLGASKPQHWACQVCNKLHVMKTSDTPRKLRAKKPCDTSIVGPSMVDGYILRHKHVQMALKLSRSGADQGRLKRLLASRTAFPEPWATVLVSKPIHTMHPRIVGERFLGYETMVFRSPTPPLFTYGIILREPLLLCPHLLRLVGSYRSMIMFQPRDPSSLILVDAIEGAYRTPGKEVHDSCKSCATDFSVQVSRTRMKLTIKIWRDYGGYASPLRWPWKAHLSTMTNNYREAVRVKRVAGSVRDLYQTGDPCSKSKSGEFIARLRQKGRNASLGEAHKDSL